MLCSGCRVICCHRSVTVAHQAHSSHAKITWAWAAICAGAVSAPLQRSWLASSMARRDCPQALEIQEFSVHILALAPDFARCARHEMSTCGWVGFGRALPATDVVEGMDRENFSCFAMETLASACDPQGLSGLAPRRSASRAAAWRVVALVRRAAPRHEWRWRRTPRPPQDRPAGESHDRARRAARCRRRRGAAPPRKGRAAPSRQGRAAPPRKGRAAPPKRARRSLAPRARGPDGAGCCSTGPASPITR